ncbi:MAG: penicillin-binding protein 2 [Chloroflexota bacterium]
MLGRTDSRGRLIFLLLAMIVVSAALTLRLAYWQVVRGADLSEEAVRQTTVRVELPSRRGAIYDRTGTVVLASSVDRDRLVAAPTRLSSKVRHDVATRLNEILGLDGEAAAALIERMASDKPYVILARDVGPASSEAIRAAIAKGTLPQVALEPEPMRIYPQEGGGPDSTLAAHLLGFVNREGMGQYGVEQRYQDVLGGAPTIVDARRDISSRLVPESDSILQQGMPGIDLRLTIDAGLQLAIEEELLATWIADDAVSASAVVLDPYTGEVYAEATYPSYSGNDYRAIAATDPGRFIDPVVSEVYEPGSVLKMLTAVAALEQGTVTPSTVFTDTGSLSLDGGTARVDNADRKGMGKIEFRDAIAYSRNVVAAKVALELGATTSESSAILHETWTRFGLGQKSGIDVAGEVAGLVRDPTITQWQEIDLANGAFGQGVAVTPMQLAVAFAAMVNGGTLVQPHVVKAVGDTEVPIAPRREVLDPALSPTMLSLMNRVVTEVDFYRDRTLVPGYYVGGKTGTAQIWDASAHEGRGAWKVNVFNYSFIGFIGRRAGHPDLIVAVRIHEARQVIRQGRAEMPVFSFELFRRIATTAIQTPGLLPELPPSPVPQAADRQSSSGDGPSPVGAGDAP